MIKNARCLANACDILMLFAGHADVGRIDATVGAFVGEPGIVSHHETQLREGIPLVKCRYKRIYYDIYIGKKSQRARTGQNARFHE